MKYIIVMMLACLLFSLPGSSSQTVDFVHASADKPSVLEGIKTVRLLVEPVTSDSARVGLNTNEVKTICLRRLKQSGIKFVEGDQDVGNPQIANLDIMVAAHRLGVSDLYSVATMVDVSEMAMLSHKVVRNGTEVPLVTIPIIWHQMRFGYAHRYNLKKYLESAFKGLVDRFCNDYMKANPQK